MDNGHNVSSSSSSSAKVSQKTTKKPYSNHNRNDTPEVSPNTAAANGYPTTAVTTSSRNGATIDEDESDPSPDRHEGGTTNYLLSEARSTPIIYSSSTRSSLISTSSSSSSDSSYDNSIPTTAAIRVKNDYDNRSLCSAHSGIQTADNSSTRNQTFYFSTPFPPQRHQPYQYHAGLVVDTPATSNSTSSNHKSSSSRKKKIKNRLSQMFTRGNSREATTGTTTTSTATSIKSAFSTSGRQTIKSWRQKRINILLKSAKQHLPDVETDAYCDVCEKHITTRIRYRNGAMVWLISFIL